MGPTYAAVGLGVGLAVVGEAVGLAVGLRVGAGVGLAEHGAADSQLAGSVLAGQCDKGPTPGGFTLDPSYNAAQSASVSQSPNPHLHPSSEP